MLCTSGFKDDVTFSYYVANGPESRTTLHFKEVHISKKFTRRWYVSQLQCWVEFIRMRHRGLTKSVIYD